MACFGRPVRWLVVLALAAVPEGTEANPDGAETVDAGWFTPGGALEAHGRGEILLVFPTIKTLEALAGFANADELLAWARERRVEPVWVSRFSMMRRKSTLARGDAWKAICTMRPSTAAAS